MSNKVYQVLSTTNLASPIAPDLNGASIPADFTTNLTHWFDPAPDSSNKFYRIKLLH